MCYDSKSRNDGVAYVNKIAQYLNGHILGEVTADPTIRDWFSTDSSVLSIKPDLVAYPRVTNDIRKIARFSWQLASKGHVLSITPRGSGSDRTGGAIGKGLILSTTSHMNQLFEYDTKQKLVRLQPGVTVAALRSALALHGTSIPKFDHELPTATVGGALARSRHMLHCIEKLEVVLSSGDVIQTGRLKGRDFEKKKKLDNFEGDIYREIDGLIEQNRELIKEKLRYDDGLDHSGYASLAEVKTKEGFDLTPLFIGSQGTLGIVSEMILKADFVNQTPAVVLAAFTKHIDAHDAIAAAEQVGPSGLEYIDGTYFERAKQAGKEFTFYKDAAKEGHVAAVIVATFNDFSERHRTRKVKQLAKIFSELGGVADFASDETISELHSVHTISAYSLMNDATLHETPPIMDGVFVPIDRFEDFSNAVEHLAKTHHVELPIYGRPIDEIWHTRPVLKLTELSDKKKLFQLMNEYEKIVTQHDGMFFGDAGEGRLKSFITERTDADLKELYAQVKDIFDPQGILNAGVKQSGNAGELGKHLRSHYTSTKSGELPRF